MWIKIKQKLSIKLVKLARKLYPENPEVTAFFARLLVDRMIYGKSIIRVEPDGTEYITFQDKTRPKYKPDATTIEILKNRSEDMNIIKELRKQGLDSETE
jgi:hypothetical protein